MIDVSEVTKKLIGNIAPVGETNADEKRFENQKECECVIRALLEEIHWVSKEKDRYEDSISKAGKRAFWFLEDLRDGLNEIVGAK